MALVFQMGINLFFSLSCGHVLDLMDYRLFLTGACLYFGIAAALYAWGSTSYALLMVFSGLLGVGYAVMGLGRALYIYQ